MRLAVLGAGSWGTALAISLAPRFDSVRLWAREPDRAEELQQTRENKRYLPGFLFPDNLAAGHNFDLVLSQTDVILSAIPSKHLRSVFQQAAPFVPTDAALVSATKGIEEQTFFRMSQVISDVTGHGPVVALSGPNFAKEVAAGEPAAVVIACEDFATAESVQRLFATPRLRFYASSDIVGVELGAALKNVIAIGAGICRGLGLGGNSVAALVTRGLAEITRLAVSMGGQPKTLSGLAGLGDLVLTTTGDLSRNRYVGIQLGEGRRLSQILAGMNMIAEGVQTCRAARELGVRQEVSLPIIDQMYQVLYEDKDPRDAIRNLMDRPLTAE
jgi:glycerol-3-phosphate dehydrogenase (NAD(P)+)